MIEAYIGKRAGEYSLNVTGHAGYAGNGYDVVCSAVSVLVCALGFVLDTHPEFGASGHIASGEAEFKVRTDGNDPTINTVFEFIEHGFKAIEADAGEYFSLKISK